MSKTALQLVQDLADFNGLGQLAGLVGSQDATVRQYLSMINRVLTELKEYVFQEQKIIKSWTPPPVLGFTKPAQSTTLICQNNCGAFNAFNFNEAYICGTSGSPSISIQDIPGSILLNGVPMSVPNGVVYNQVGPEFAYFLFDTTGYLFPTTGLPRPIVLVKFDGTNWLYDNNGGDVPFTPTSTMWLIGEYQNLAGDTNLSPGQYGSYMYASGVQVTSINLAATQDQGALTTLFGEDFLSLIPETGWNKTRRMRIYGPVSDATWQALQVLPNAGPEFQSYIAGNHLYISPTPKPSETLSMTVYTKSLVLAADGMTTRESIAVDNDTFLVPDIVMQLGLQYTWEKQKGVPDWEDTYNEYISAVAKNRMRAGDATLRMDLRDSPSTRPGIVIPAGSWNVQTS